MPSSALIALTAGILVFALVRLVRLWRIVRSPRTQRLDPVTRRTDHLIATYRSEHVQPDEDLPPATVSRNPDRGASHV